MAKNSDLYETAIPEEETAKQIKKKEKAKKKQEKKNRNLEEDEEERAGGKLILFFVTLLIIAIWLGIIAILVKSDVGGFGSSVLYPILKDVPYVNVILPEPEGGDYTQDTTDAYRTLDEAKERIKELETALDTALENTSNDAKVIEELRAQVNELVVYKEEEASFEKEKEKFYEEVVFSDVAPDISEYRTFYESIDPENAAVLYKQVIEQITYDESVQDYVKTYSQMQAKDAAKIFDDMTGNLGLVADILMNMGPTARANILAEMKTETAARLTEIMEPRK